MSKRKNLNNVDLSFHLQHPGRGNEPGDPNAIFYLNGVYHLHYILRHKWNGVRKNLPRSNFLTITLIHLFIALVKTC